MQGAPSRFAPDTPIPLGVASGARSEGIGLPSLPGQRQADPLSARCRCRAAGLSSGTVGRALGGTTRRRDDVISGQLTCGGRGILSSRAAYVLVHAGR